MNYEKKPDAKAFLKVGLISGLFFCLFFGTALIFLYDLHAALVMGPIAGMLFGLIMGLMLYFFSKSRSVNNQSKLEGVDESEIVYAGAANHFKKKEAVGGKLYLSNDHLIFKSHNLNIQNHTLSIEINNINEVTFFSPLGLAKTGLQITLKDNAVEKFVVNNRNIWRQHIEQLINKF
ncbi:GRAM domain-containing protein [Pedobacter borealis]|uniref:GRAM domain-containing protein n=1 Tax=Pedobacter borealis TaxID=475254 RepID=UPI00049372C0|nr:GRAM domain-containing protein [Pedobacter borealis]